MNWFFFSSFFIFSILSSGDYTQHTHTYLHADRSYEFISTFPTCFPFICIFFREVGRAEKFVREVNDPAVQAAILAAAGRTERTEAAEESAAEEEGEEQGG